MVILCSILALLLQFVFAICVDDRRSANGVPILPFNLQMADQNGDGKVSLAELRDFLASEPFSQRFKVPLFDANGGEIALEQMSTNLPAEVVKLAEEADKAPKNGKLDFAEWTQFIYTLGEKVLDTDGDGIISKQELEAAR